MRRNLVGLHCPTPRGYLSMNFHSTISSTVAAVSLASLWQLPTSLAATFDGDVRPFIETHCADCHDKESSKGDIVLTDLTADFSTEAMATRWQHMLEQVQADVMPPMKVKVRPATDERRMVIAWVESNLLASPHGSTYRKKLSLPQYGNYVDHERLFSGVIKTPAFSPSRLWRLSPYIFNAKRGVNKAVKGRQNPFTFSTSPHGIRDYANTSNVGASTIETIVLNANAELEFLFEEAEKIAATGEKNSRRPNVLAPFFRKDHQLSTDELRRPISDTFRRLASRDPTQEELSKYVALLEKNITDSGDPAASLRSTLKAIYLSPEAIYRMEWGLGAEDEHGRRMLSPNEIAYALSYALYDEAPNGGSNGSGLIGKALAEGKLSSKQDVATLLENITASEQHPPIGGQAKDSMPRVIRFFHEFFGYRAALDVFKDDERTAQHDIYNNPRTLVNDADNLLKVILREDENVFEELLTTNRALVFHNGDNQGVIDAHQRTLADLKTWDEERVKQDVAKRKAGVLKKPKYKNNPKLVPAAHAKIDKIGKTMLVQKKKEYRSLLESGPVMRSVKSREYGYLKAYNLTMKTWKWSPAQPFELPADQRAGMLTHPAWLVAHSLNDGNDPISRGIWVYEKLLAGALADVPPDVDAQVPKDEHETLRERMSILRAKQCWICHRKINPIGEPFEAYDDFGRHREKHFFDDDGKLVTSRVLTTENAAGESVRKRIDREALAAAGKFTTKPVDASGSFAELGIAGLEGDFDNAIEMIHAIAKTDRARQSIIRHLFRFLMGRNEMLSDSSTLVAADRAYLDSGGSFNALLVSLLSSDSFLYRR
ncbi:MAG: hypothetical protein ACI8XO_004685 [Verrucomicrobiales bacterium]|jgi:hypothetical protein